MPSFLRTFLPQKLTVFRLKNDDLKSVQFLHGRWKSGHKRNWIFSCLVQPATGINARTPLQDCFEVTNIIKFYFKRCWTYLQKFYSLQNLIFWVLHKCKMLTFSGSHSIWALSLSDIYSNSKSYRFIISIEEL